MPIRYPLLIGAALSLTVAACYTARTPTLPNQAKIAVTTEDGLLTCFPADVAIEGKPVWCEASAVLFNDNALLLANDKDMPPGQSSVFSTSLEKLADTTQLPTYLTAPAYGFGRKYEDFAQTPDRQFVFLTTAFDRVKLDRPDWDAYNTILYWRRGDEAHPHVLSPDGLAKTSVGFRPKLARALASTDLPGAAPYFKIEGLAATDRQLLFGIREVGQAFDKFTYANKIVAVSYTVGKMNNEDRIQLFDDWRVVADFKPVTVIGSLPKTLGLSSLEYDPFHRCLWMLTSLEQDGRMDAYLWSISPADLRIGKPFKLARNKGGRPLRFGHKAEDLTPIDGDRLLIIHDDDRAQPTVGGQTRQPNQAAYTILRVR